MEVTCTVQIPSLHLLVQSNSGSTRTNEIWFFLATKEDVIDVWWLWTELKHCFDALSIDFEQVNTNWVIFTWIVRIIQKVLIVLVWPNTDFSSQKYDSGAGFVLELGRTVCRCRSNQSFCKMYGILGCNCVLLS